MQMDGLGRQAMVSYICKLAIHLFLMFVSFIVAYELRRGLPLAWWFTEPQALLIVGWGLLYIFIAFCVEMVFRTELASWRFSSSREALKLARSTATTAGLFLVILFLSDRAISLPRSALVLAWLISLFALVGVRLVWRMIHDRSLALSLLASDNHARKHGTPVVVVGGLAEAESFIRRGNTLGDDLAPVGIVASGDLVRGQHIHGVRILGSLAGPRDLVTLVAPFEPKRGQSAAILFLQDPLTELNINADQIGSLKAGGFKLLRQPSIVEFREHGEPTTGVREMQLEEFLPREPLALNPGPIKTLVAGRRVLVTGAGGSIGSEIARQLTAFGCSHLTLVDHSEFLLFQIDRELESHGGGGTRRAFLCNVRDEARVKEIFNAERPEIVFHAAALKHVTLVENNPCEGVLTNIVGTHNVVQASQVCGARQMILVSTDKAVSPTNVMGATKRLAESLLSPRVGDTQYSVVRFGNVLGSAGSVVPIFKDQIARGGPITVTDPEVERFFMTIPEAVQLVLHATALSSGATDGRLRKFVLEMGKPVKIVELARQMIKLSGLTPDRDIRIEFTGLQPGEKLTEQLVDENEVVSPCLEGISEINPIHPEVMPPEALRQLEAHSRAGDGRGVNRLIFSTLNTLRSQDRGVDVVGA